jgi:hypothetical protein
MSMQVMLPSHVSGGYWCQCPKELAPHLPSVDSDLLFETPDRRVAPSSFNAEGYTVGNGRTGTWKVVLLQRDGGSIGFSGGWRGFAIDQVIGSKHLPGFAIDKVLDLRHTYTCPVL